MNGWEKIVPNSGSSERGKKGVKEETKTFCFHLQRNFSMTSKKSFLEQQVFYKEIDKNFNDLNFSLLF